MKWLLIVLPIFTVISFSFLQIGCTVSVGTPPAPVYVQSPAPPPPGPPPWAPAHGYRAKYHYYYYPYSQIYFDTGRSLYFYYSGGGWQASVALPSGIYVAASEHVVLEMDADRPYVYHTDVEKIYPPGQVKNKGKGKGKKWD